MVNDYSVFLSISVIFLGINDPVGTISVNYFETNLIISQIYLTALFALLVSFFSASQDIVIDAYRIEILKESEQGAGAAMTQAGYRIGGIISGAGALYLREYISWELVFISLGLTILLFFLITIFLPDTVNKKTRDTGARDYFNPLKEFIFRVNFRRVFLILLFIFSFKLCDAVAGVMANPFMSKLVLQILRLQMLVKF